MAFIAVQKKTKKKQNQIKIKKDMGFKMRYSTQTTTQEPWACEELLGGALP